MFQCVCVRQCVCARHSVCVCDIYRAFLISFHLNHHNEELCGAKLNLCLVRILNSGSRNSKRTGTAGGTSISRSMLAKGDKDDQLSCNLINAEATRAHGGVRDKGPGLLESGTISEKGVNGSPASHVRPDINSSERCGVSHVRPARRDIMLPAFFYKRHISAAAMWQVGFK